MNLPAHMLELHIGPRLRSHDSGNLAITCRTHYASLAGELRGRALREREELCKSFVGNLDHIDHRTIDALAEHISSFYEIECVSPELLQRLAQSVRPEIITKELPSKLARYVLPILPEDATQSLFAHAMQYSDLDLRRFAYLSHLGHVGKQLPRESLPALRDAVNQAPHGRRTLIYTSVAQLHHGFSGDSSDEKELRNALIKRVFALQHGSRTTRHSRAALAGLWSDLDDGQRLAVAHAASSILKSVFDKGRLEGLSEICICSHILNTRASTEAFGALVHSLPGVEKAAFLGALRGLSDKHFALTVHDLGDTFAETFPEIFHEARTRVKDAAAAGNLCLTDVPLRMRPHSALGVPEALRNPPQSLPLPQKSLVLSATPELRYESLLGELEAAPRKNEITGLLAHTAAAAELLDEIRANPRNILTNTPFCKSISVFGPADQIKCIDVLVSTGYLHQVNDGFFHGIHPSAARHVAEHVRRVLDSSTEVALPPVQHLPAAELRNALALSHLVRWKAASQHRSLNQHQVKIAQDLENGLPSLQRAGAAGIDAWLEASRRDWLAAVMQSTEVSLSSKRKHESILS